MAKNRSVLIQTIYETSIEMFKEKGYDGVSVNDICKAVGITKPTFYKYVASKEEILTNYFASSEANDALDSLCTAVLSGPSNQNYVEAVIEVFDVTFRHYLSLGIDLLRSHMISMSGKYRMIFEINDVWRKTLMELIEKGQQSGQIWNTANSGEILSSLTYTTLGYAYYLCTQEKGEKGLEDLNRMLRAICLAKPPILS